MKNEKIKEILSKVGKATLPAMMLLSGAWKGNTAAMSSTDLELRAKEQEQKTPAIEMQINDSEEGYSKNLAGCYGCSGTCWGGCSGFCTGACTGCSGSCSGTCTGCSGSCSGSCNFSCTGSCSGSCMYYF